MNLNEYEETDDFVFRDRDKKEDCDEKIEIKLLFGDTRLLNHLGPPRNFRLQQFSHLLWSATAHI